MVIAARRLVERGAQANLWQDLATWLSTKGARSAQDLR
jgi:hypothetical protein